MEEVWYCFLNKNQLGERWIVFSAAEERRNLSMARFSICSRYIFCSCLDSVMEGVREEVGLSSASSCVFSQGIVLWESCSNGGFSTATRRRRGWSCRHGIAKQGNWKMLLYSRSVSSCTGLFPAFEVFPRESEWRAIFAAVDPVYSEQRLGLKVLLTCASVELLQFFPRSVPTLKGLSPIASQSLPCSSQEAGCCAWLEEAGYV